jgi:hypothetical protein
MLSTLWVAIFFILLLRYWLRSVEHIKDASNQEQVIEQNNSEEKHQVNPRSRGASILEKLKSAYFFVLLILVMTIYVVNFLNVQYDPSLNPRTPYARALLPLEIIVGIFMALYLIFYLFTFVRNVVYLCGMTVRSRWLFLFSQCMQIILIFTVLFGVYSPLYANGGLLVFFIALCNLYVWSLIYLNWPVDDHLYD